MGEMDFIYWSHSYNAILTVNLTIAVFLFISSRLFLGVAVDDEVINQRNMMLGVVRCVIYISLGLLLAELME